MLLPSAQRGQHDSPRFAEPRFNFGGHFLDKVEVHTVGFQLRELISTPARTHNRPRCLPNERMECFPIGESNHSLLFVSCAPGTVMEDGGGRPVLLRLETGDDSFM